MSREEQDQYVEYITSRHPDKDITQLDLKIDGDFVDMTYHCAPQNFERIRRITGYLVGTIDRWNNGKKAEERDRVKHSVFEEI